MKKIIYFIVFLFILVGCGGGGSGSQDLSSKPSSDKISNLSKTSSILVARETVAAVSLLDFYGQATDFNGRKITVSQQREGNICNNTNGSATIDKKSNTKFDITFNNCALYDETIDSDVLYTGKISVTTNENQEYYDLVYKDLEAHYISGVIVNFKYAKVYIKYSNYKITKMYAKATLDTKKMEYFNFNYSFNGDLLNPEVTFDGWIKCDNTNGYVYIKSLSKISNNQGKMEVSAQGKKILIELKDESVKVTDIKGDQKEFYLELLASNIKNIDALTISPSKKDIASLNLEKTSNIIAPSVGSAYVVNYIMETLHKAYNIECDSGKKIIDNNQIVFKNCEFSEGDFGEKFRSFKLNGKIYKQDNYDEYLIAENLTYEFKDFEADEITTLDVKYAKYASSENSIYKIYANFSKNNHNIVLANFSYDDLTEKFIGWEKIDCLGQYVNISLEMENFGLFIEDKEEKLFNAILINDKLVVSSNIDSETKKLDKDIILKPFEYNCDKE